MDMHMGAACVDCVDTLCIVVRVGVTSDMFAHMCLRVRGRVLALVSMNLECSR